MLSASGCGLCRKASRAGWPRLASCGGPRRMRSFRPAMSVACRSSSGRSRRAICARRTWKQRRRNLPTRVAVAHGVGQARAHCGCAGAAVHRWTTRSCCPARSAIVRRACHSSAPACCTSVPRRCAMRPQRVAATHDMHVRARRDGRRRPGDRPARRRASPSPAARSSGGRHAQRRCRPSGGPLGQIIELANHFRRGVEVLGDRRNRVAALHRVVRRRRMRCSASAARGVCSKPSAASTGTSRRYGPVGSVAQRWKAGLSSYRLLGADAGDLRDHLQVDLAAGRDAREIGLVRNRAEFQAVAPGVGDQAAHRQQLRARRRGSRSAASGARSRSACPARWLRSIARSTASSPQL